MSQPRPYEQLSFPEPTPERESVADPLAQPAGLTAEEERAFDLQDSKAPSNNIARARMGRAATAHTVEPAGDAPTTRRTRRSRRTSRRLSARDQARGETTPADDGAWSDHA